jgi:hypothetical protein
MKEIGRRAIRVASGAAALVAAVCVSPSAASAQVATLDERVAGAQRVVVATARAVQPEWRENAHGDRLIVSRVQLDVEEVLKGAAERVIWLDVEGGTLDGLTLRVSSLPVIQGGERAVFFLDRGAGASHVPHLRGQGILFLDDQDVVRGSNLRLSEIRTRARGAGR